MPDRRRAARRRRLVIDWTFDVSMILKAIDGVIEVIGGAMLLVVSADALNNLAVRFTSAELSQDPDDFVAHRLLRLTADLHHTRTFGAVYLISHGFVKIVLVAAVLRRQRWAYPAMCAFLLLFIAYQCYRMTYAPSVGLAALTIFDGFVVWLTRREYQLHDARAAAA
jgi:uncharacterized membrane protein